MNKIPRRPGAPRIYANPWDNVPNGKFYLESNVYARGKTRCVEIMEDQHGKQWVYFEKETQKTIELRHLDSDAKLYPRTD